MTQALTRGAHHVGLSVPDLEGAVSFFRDALGYVVVGERPDYPAAFVTDGKTMLTLWQVADPKTATRFDRRANVGLHHLALAILDDAALDTVHARVSGHPGVICTMPGGIRIEFATPFA